MNTRKDICELKRIIDKYLSCDSEGLGLYIPYMELYIPHIRNNHITMYSKYNPTIDQMAVNICITLECFIDIISKYKAEYNNRLPFDSQRYTKELKSIISR